MAKLLSSTTFKKMKDFANDNEKTLSVTIVILLIFAAEELMTKEFYTCPDKYYIAYGILVLVVPIICLISVVVVTQRCIPPSTTAFRAFIAAFIWVVFAFGETDVLVCIRLGPKTAATDPADYERKYKETRGISQIVALGMLVFIALVCCVYFGFYKKGKLIPKVEEFDILACEAAADKIKEEMKKLANEEANELCTIVRNDANKDLRVLVGEKLTEVGEKYPRAAKGWGNKYRVEINAEGPMPGSSTAT